MKTLPELMDCWEQGNLSPDDLRQLKTLLREPDVRAHLRAEACFYGLLKEVLSAADAEVQIQFDEDVPRGFRARIAAFVRPRIPAALFSRPALVWVSVALVLAAGALLWAARPSTLAFVSQSGDGVFITHSSRTYPAHAGAKIRAGDSVSVSQFASTAFQWRNENTRFYLSPDTKVQVNQTRAGKHIRLSSGILKAVVARQPPGRPLVVTSPAALARIVGTQFTLSTSAKGDRLEVVEGTIEFTDAQQQQPGVVVHAGDSALSAAALPIDVKPMNGVAWWEVWPAGVAALANDTPPAAGSVFQDYLGGAYTLVWSYPFISDWSRPYRERVQGFIVPEQTGSYTFWMMSQEASELWLSPDASPINKVKIASTPAPPPGTPLTQTWNWVLQPGTDQTALRNSPWNKFPSQKSAPQRLIAGQRYYFEALHELVAGDCLSVVWSRPDDDFPAETIPARVLLPFRK